MLQVDTVLKECKNLIVLASTTQTTFLLTRVSKTTHQLSLALLVVVPAFRATLLAAELALLLMCALMLQEPHRNIVLHLRVDVA